MPQPLANLLKDVTTREHVTHGLERLLSHLKNCQQMELLYVADAASVTDFVAWLKIAIQERHRRKFMTPQATVLDLQRSRDRMDARVTALCLLEQSLIPRLAGARFRRVNGANFTFQLALRIVRPELVNQDGMRGIGCCTLAAMMAQIARTDPVALALYASNLFLFGNANLGGLPVSPNPETYSGHNQKMSECDYVLLASLRDIPGVLVSFRSAREYAADLCRNLKSAGYTSIEDHSFHADGLKCTVARREKFYGPRPPGFSWPVNHTDKRMIFDEMLAKFAGGCHTIMIADPEIARSLRDNRPLSHSLVNGLPVETHATAITQIIRRPNDHVDLKLYSWGRKFGTQGTSCHRQGLHIETLVSRYGGFVSYRDR